MIDDLLKKFNINPDTLNASERETLEKWSKALSVQQLSLTDVRTYIGTMIESLERELTGHDDAPQTFASFLFRRKRERHLKARLQNYILLRDFLTAPERARSYVEKQLSQFKK